MKNKANKFDNVTFNYLGHVWNSNAEARLAAFGSDWRQLFAIRKHNLLTIDTMTTLHSKQGVGRQQVYG